LFPCRFKRTLPNGLQLSTHTRQSIEALAAQRRKATKSFAITGNKAPGKKKEPKAIRKRHGGKAQAAKAELSLQKKADATKKKLATLKEKVAKAGGKKGKYLLDKETKKAAKQLSDASPTIKSVKELRERFEVQKKKLQESVDLQREADTKVLTLALQYQRDGTEESHEKLVSAHAEKKKAAMVVARDDRTATSSLDELRDARGELVGDFWFHYLRKSVSFFE
jgi:hypothetical protein